MPKPRPEELTFEQWVKALFDVPPGALMMIGGAAGPHPESEPRVIIAYMTRLFENAKEVLAPYSDDQVADGLHFIISNMCSDNAMQMKNRSLPWPERRRCIRAIEALYRDIFVPRCPQVLRHVGKPPYSKLTDTCFMIFDWLPIHGAVKDPDVDAEVLALMERLLQIDHLAVRESALHGLNHWHLAYPEEVTRIIRNFLDTTPTTAELWKYAMMADAGMNP